MNRFDLMLLLCFISCYSFAQVEKQVHSALLKRDFKAFYNISESYAPEKNNVLISASIRRELITGVHESLFYLVRSYPVNEVVSITSTSRISIISHGNLIIYFRFECKKIKDSSNPSPIPNDTVYTFTDKPKIETLKSQFQRTYSAPLNEKELFIDTIYYGQKCGHNGNVFPNEQLEIYNWVTIGDTSHLRQWLQSTITEKQVYAVQGFHSLLRRGWALNEETKRLIKAVMQKKGTITTCGHCDSGQHEISQVTQNFKF